ncbi:MAG: NAD-dependent epimerase/dehydratase family protein, partial [Nocardioidaceae bacterium]
TSVRLRPIASFRTDVSAGGSSCTTASLYDVVPGFEVDETSPVAPGSPYARTKRVMEMALEEISAGTDLRAIILRYFNPVGSDPDVESGLYDCEPSHVIGQLVLAAQGVKDAFTITGTEHPTRDGTGIRDYLHVWDLAQAHVAAVERFDQVLDAVGAPSTIINIGTGEGVTVRELLAAFERVYGGTVPTREAPPRPGDAVGAYANVDKARAVLGWGAALTLDDAIASALAWGRRRKEILGFD